VTQNIEERSVESK